MISVVIRINQFEGAFTVKHSFDSTLFNDLRSVKGGKYLYENKCFIFSIEHHEEQVFSIIKGHNSSVSVEETQEALFKLYPDIEVLSDNELHLIKEFRKHLTIRNESQRTIESYISSIKKMLIFFRDTGVEDLTESDINDFQHYLCTVRNYSFSTLNVYISAIKLFRKCVLKQNTGPIKIERPKIKSSLPKILSEKEVTDMIECTRNLKHKFIIMMYYSTAMRREELINLKLEDVHIEEKYILINGKGNKQRVAYLSDTLIKMMKRYLKAYKPNEYLIEGQNGKKYSETSVLKVVKNAAKLANIEKNVTPHMLRHSFATHMINSGVSPVHVQKLLGHKSIQTTMIYTHLVDEDLRKLRNPLDNLDLNL